MNCSSLLCRALASLLLGSAACGSPKAPERDPEVLLAQDFEALNGWAGVLADDSPGATLSVAVAHSGRCAARVGGTAEYGLGFAAPFRLLTKKRPKSLEISYWCYRTDTTGNAATMVCTIVRPSTKQQLYWKGADLQKEIREDHTWTKITQRIDIPAEVDFSDTFRLYAWRGAAGSDVFFDDLQVRQLPD